MRTGCLLEKQIYNWVSGTHWQQGGLGSAQLHPPAPREAVLSGSGVSGLQKADCGNGENA